MIEYFIKICLNKEREKKSFINFFQSFLNLFEFIWIFQESV